ncbi:hypothetical protein [Kineococcus sp. SYSU DK002]|uniref:hypothetical protein n=1 Tax=Kineococcus sp. SYSU DK002 TaxID=3383123 RepID=UPI003D7DE21A
MTAAATLGVAGCSVFSPPTVLKPYEPSDGAGASLGGVDIRNVLLVSSGVDEPGVLSAVLVNSSFEPVDVSVSVDVAAGSASAQTFSLPENSSLHIGDLGAAAPDGPAVTADDAATTDQTAWLQVPQVPVVPGQTVPVTFTVGGQEASVDAQVMLPCFEYAAITPTVPAATPSEEPTATSTVTAAAAPTPTSTVTCGPQGDEEGTEQGAEEGGEED